MLSHEYHAPKPYGLDGHPSCAFSVLLITCVCYILNEPPGPKSFSRSIYNPDQCHHFIFLHSGYQPLQRADLVTPVHIHSIILLTHRMNFLIILADLLYTEPCSIQSINKPLRTWDIRLPSCLFPKGRRFGVLLLNFHCIRASLVLP